MPPKWHGQDQEHHKLGLREEFYNPLTDEQLKVKYELWKSGVMSKVQIEKALGDGLSKGTGITRAWRERLGINTIGMDAKDMRIRELEEQLRKAKGEGKPGGNAGWQGGKDGEGKGGEAHGQG